MQTLKEVFLVNSLSGNRFTSLWELSYLCQKDLKVARSLVKHNGSTMRVKPSHIKKNPLLSSTADVEVLRPNELSIYFMACSHRDSKAFLCSAGRKIHSSHI